ncbi:hypothetical protein CRUP_018295 [Coryphaenoides rupestris]|nr:hypothetical protein CRUP_018295 [Coryphaenoides rupestris]
MDDQEQAGSSLERWGVLRLDTWWLFSWCLSCSAPLHGCMEVASFYGDGYIYLRTEEISTRNSLHLRFRTASQSGLLFLASGGGDFLLLEITSGRLQVRVDLGSGERTLRSAGGLHLSDLAWHRVELTHLLHNVSLSIDRSYRTSVTLPGAGDLELSVRPGVFVGGTPGQQHPLVWSSPGFRGCMEEVVFNKHRLLASLQSDPGPGTVQRVSQGCSPEFWATEVDPVGFLSSQSFLKLLPPWDVPQQVVLEFQLCPSARSRMVRSCTPPPSREASSPWRSETPASFASVRCNGGSSRTEVRSVTRLQGNQSTWYPVRLQLAPDVVQLWVGQEVVEAGLDAEVNVVLKPTGPLYLGGLDEAGRVEAGQAGAPGSSTPGGGSFSGCLRDVKVNGRHSGLPHATVTRDVSVGCGGRGQRSETETALRELLEHLNPDDEDTKQPTNASRGQGRRKSSSGFLVLEELEVDEGGRALLEPKHIQVEHFNVPVT